MLLCSFFQQKRRIARNLFLGRLAITAGSTMI
uniref:Uncharacterized protein n=1 Tax=Arundo donax TaxID=35708 RepID=A0A0A8ZZV3_ARUDO